MTAKKTGWTYSDKNYQKGSNPPKGTDSKRNYPRESSDKPHYSDKETSRGYDDLEKGHDEGSNKDYESDYPYVPPKSRDRQWEDPWNYEKGNEDREDSKRGSETSSNYSNERHSEELESPEKDYDEDDFHSDAGKVESPEPSPGDSGGKDGGKQPLPEADMTFTEEEVYGDIYEPPVRDEIYDDGEPDTEEPVAEPTGPGTLTNSMIREVKERMRIPEEGFLVQTPRGRLRRNLEVERIRQLGTALQQEQAQTHIRQTLELFVNDTDERSRQDRASIDLALVLAVAIRESGVRIVLSRSSQRIVSAGRDAHTEGRSGLDWLYDYKRFFPSAIRNEIQPVEGNERIPGSFRREVHPAFIRESDLLAAFIVEIRQRYRRFLRRFEHHEFRDFSSSQQQALLSSMNRDAKRAWTQAAFGSRLHHLLIEVRNGILRPMRSGTSFEELVLDPMLNLNAIINNDTIMPDNLSRQRCRISAAEALLAEELINQQF